MEQILVYMLVVVSWSGGTETPRIERVQQLFTTQAACEAEGRRALERVKADEKIQGQRAAYECLPVPDMQEYDAAFADAQPKK